MRVGQNPAKAVDTVARPAKTTVAVVVYIPFIGGYYQHSLEVLKLCLESIWQNTRMPYDLMVFDNASCAEVRSYLQKAQAEGKIQYLTLSDKNIGKVGAWNFIFGAAPGEYIAYADADVYHYPGWLAPQIEALDAFPKAGMVTGLPLLSPEQYSTATVAWAEDHPDVVLARGQLLPWEDFWRHAGSLGGGEEQARIFYQQNPSLRITAKGKRYYVGAAHFQFVARKQVLNEVGVLHADRPMGQVRQLDEAINGLGYLRLSTPEWHVQHLGNTPPDDGFLAGRTRQGHARPQEKASSSKRLWAWKPIQKIVRWLYSKSFDILYKN